MADVRVVFKPNALYHLRSEPGVVADLEARAARVKKAAEADGRGKYVTGSRQGARRPEGRWRTTVVTADVRAMRAQVKRQTLLRALDSGR